MELKFVDPRALKENLDKARRSKSNPQADALLLATIRAVGIVQPPVVAPETDGGNGFVIDAVHRRVKQAIAAGLKEIAVLVTERAKDGGAMRSLAETLAHEQRNPVDQWRAIERLTVSLWAVSNPLDCWRCGSRSGLWRRLWRLQPRTLSARWKCGLSAVQPLDGPVAEPMESSHDVNQQLRC